MDVPVRDLKTRLAHYLRLAEQGETVVVTSHKKPLVRLVPVASPPTGLPAVPGLRWSAKPPAYKRRRVADLPAVAGAPLADWVVENRR